MSDISSRDSIREQMRIAADSVDRELFKALKEEFDMEKSCGNEEEGIAYIDPQESNKQFGNLGQPPLVGQTPYASKPVTHENYYVALQNRLLLEAGRHRL